MRALSPRLLRLAARLGIRDAEADDLVAETLYRGLMRLAQLEHAAAVEAWFSRILVNLWRDTLRRREARRTFTSLDELASEPADPRSVDPAEDAEAGEREQRIAAAVARLPTAQREAMALHLQGGLSPAEIAAVLGSTSERVRANLSQARRRLRGWLRDLEEEPRRPKREIVEPGRRRDER